MPNGGKKKGMPTWLKVIIGLAIFAIVIVVISFMATSPIVKPVEKQLKYLKSGDVEAAYELTSGEFKNATSYETFQEFLTKYPTLTTNDSYSFNSREIETSGDTEVGTLTGTLKATDGTETPIEFRLIKENGEWKILGIQVGGE